MLLGGGGEAQHKTLRKDRGRWVLEDVEKSEPSSWAGEDTERETLQNGRQFLKRLNASHRRPGRPPTQERAQEKQSVHGRAPGHPAPAGDKHGRTAERSSAARVTDTLTSSC